MATPNKPGNPSEEPPWSSPPPGYGPNQYPHIPPPPGYPAQPHYPQQYPYPANPSYPHPGYPSPGYGVDPQAPLGAIRQQGCHFLISPP
jgi:hypothetical protein